MTREEAIAAAKKQAAEDFLKRTPAGQRLTLEASGQGFKMTAFEQEATGQHEKQLAGRHGPGVSDLAPEEPEDGGMIDGLVQFAKQGALPAAGATIGMMSPIPGGTALGGGFGEMANQALGITEPSGTAILSNAIAPVGGKLALQGFQGAKRNAMRTIPGSGAAINEMAAETAAAIPPKIGPERTIEGIMKLVGVKNPGADTSALQQAIMGKLPELAANPDAKVSQMLYGIADEMAKGTGGTITIHPHSVKGMAAKLMEKETKMGEATGSAPIKAMAKEFDDLVKTHPNGVPFDTLYARLQRLNGEVGGAKGELQGAYKSLIGAIEDDIEFAVRNSADDLPAAQAFRTAQAAWKKEKGEAAVLDLVTRATSKRASDELIQFNRGTITKALDNDKRLQKLLGPEAVKFIRDELSGIGIITGLPPGPGQHFGSGRNVLGAGAGLAGSLMAGHNPVMATAISASVPVAMELISKAAMTETGRAMIKHFAKAGKGTLGPQAMSILAAYVEGGTHVIDGAMEMATQ